MNAVKVGAGLFILSIACGIAHTLLEEPGVLLAFGELLSLAAVILVLAGSLFFKNS